MDNLEEQLKSVTSHISKLLRQKFGRGPEICQGWYHSHYIVIYIRGFISPIEESLLTEGHRDLAAQSRNKILEKFLLPEIKGIIETMLNIDVEGFYQDWNYENNTGMISATLRNQDSVPRSFPECDEVIKETIRISQMVQKAPEETEAIQISNKVYVIIRKGILITLEKALIAKGYEDVLRTTKAEMEKVYFHHNKFSVIFKHDVKDIFIDWNLKEDQSLICLILK